MFRRCMWNFFRVEFEHIQTYDRYFNKIIPSYNLQKGSADEVFEVLKILDGDTLGDKTIYYKPEEK